MPPVSSRLVDRQRLSGPVGFGLQHCVRLPQVGRSVSDSSGGREVGVRRYPPVGWQPSRFLIDQAEAERAFRLAERLGSVNAAAAELGTTWPSLRKAFARHGLGMPARNPESVRQRTGQPSMPTLDPGFVALNPGVLPARER